MLRGDGGRKSLRSSGLRVCVGMGQRQCRLRHLDLWAVVRCVTLRVVRKARNGGARKSGFDEPGTRLGRSWQWQHGRGSGLGRNWPGRGGDAGIMRRVDKAAGGEGHKGQCYVFLGYHFVDLLREGRSR